MNYRPIWLALAAASLLSILWLAHIADAQAPQPRAPRANLGTAFTYQGQLKSSGAPYTGACDFQFKLYDDASAGAQIGSTQTASSVSVSSGFFTTSIDFGAGAFDGNARWLDISVRCPAGSGSYTTLTPRQAMTPAPYALALPGLYTQQNVVSPNLIGGYSGNIISNTVIGGTIGGGGQSAFPNRVWSNFATVGGGFHNTAAASFATIDGGSWNTVAITGYYSAIGGGANNTASGQYATIGGGYMNIASNQYASIGGGVYNEATGVASVVAGGGAVSCGAGCTFLTRNKASGDASNVGGGFGNTASGNYATVPGGASNSATISYTLAAGRRAKANHDGTFVWGDSTDADFSSTANNQFLVRAGGGAMIVRGASTFNTVASNALQVENATTGGEAAWMRVGSASNSQPVVSLIKQSAGAGYFLQCWNESAGTFFSKCHIDSAGSFVGGSDFAESLRVIGIKADYAPGDVIALSVTNPGSVEKTNRAYSRDLIGVYSTRPGFLGADKNGIVDVGADEIPVALTGIVPVNVSLENGVIHIGDPLTSSAIPGVAMKATRAGKIIGYAMADANANGVVSALIQPGYFAPSEESETSQLDVRALAALESRLTALEHNAQTNLALGLIVGALLGGCVMMHRQSVNR